jgi:hypothetical protein
VTFNALTPEQWKAIRSLGKGLSPKVLWSEVREEIEQAGRDFWVMRTNRMRRPPVDERDRLKRALGAVRKLRNNLPDDLARITALVSLERAIGNRLIIFEIWAGKSFKSQADAHRALLYSRLLLMWTQHLSPDDLPFSRTVHNVPPAHW